MRTFERVPEARRGAPGGPGEAVGAAVPAPSKTADFGRLVLGCINADFCDQILVGKLSTRSTRCTYFCTAQISKFQEKKCRDFGKNESIHNSIHSNFRNFDIVIAILHLNFGEIFSEFHRCVRKCENSLRIAEKLQKKKEISVKFPNLVTLFFRSE